MIEYMIYRQNKRGKPFYLDTYKNLETAKYYLYNMINYNIKKGYTYFVDNDFFDNKYNMQMQVDFYYCIKFREYKEWQVYSEKSKIQENDNLLYFKLK